jgi:hypothetical protein
MRMNCLENTHMQLYHHHNVLITDKQSPVSVSSYVAVS